MKGATEGECPGAAEGKESTDASERKFFETHGSISFSMGRYYRSTEYKHRWRTMQHYTIHLRTCNTQWHFTVMQYAIVPFILKYFSLLTSVLGVSEIEMCGLWWNPDYLSRGPTSAFGSPESTLHKHSHINCTSWSYNHKRLSFKHSQSTSSLSDDGELCILSSERWQWMDKKQQNRRTYNTSLKQAPQHHIKQVHQLTLANITPGASSITSVIKFCFCRLLFWMYITANIWHFFTSSH